MEQKILLLYAKPYSMFDEEAKRQVDGVSIRYLLVDSLAAVVSPDGSKGIGVGKCSLPVEAFSKITAAPAFYIANFEMKLAASGKISLNITDLAFDSLVEIESVDKATKPVK